MSAKLTHKTRNLDRLIKTLNKLEKVEVTAGVYQNAGKHSEAGIHNAALLAMHELSDGSHYPKRPVMKTATDDNGEFWGVRANNDLGKLFSRAGLSKVLTYSQILSALQPTGKVMAEDIQDTFGSSSLASNSIETIRIKGFNSPLIESGELHDSIKSKARRKAN